MGGCSSMMSPIGVSQIESSRRCFSSIDSNDNECSLRTIPLAKLHSDLLVMRHDKFPINNVGLQNEDKNVTKIALFMLLLVFFRLIYCQYPILKQEPYFAQKMSCIKEYFLKAVTHPSNCVVLCRKFWISWQLCNQEEFWVQFLWGNLMKERLDGNWLVFMAKTTNIRKIRQLIFQSSF